MIAKRYPDSLFRDVAPEIFSRLHLLSIVLASQHLVYSGGPDPRSQRPAGVDDQDVDDLWGELGKRNVEACSARIAHQTPCHETVGFPDGRPVRRVRWWVATV